VGDRARKGKFGGKNPQGKRTRTQEESSPPKKGGRETITSNQCRKKAGMVPKIWARKKEIGARGLARVKSPRKKGIGMTNFLQKNAGGGKHL